MAIPPLIEISGPLANTIMERITRNEIRALLSIVKSPETLYNANSLSKVLGISSMGSLKILKRLEKESLLTSKQIGKSVVYKINTGNAYSRDYIKLLLAGESLNALQTAKRWVSEIRRIKNAELAILFGSVLQKTGPKDIDVLFVTDKQKFNKLKEEIEEINEISVKKIHPIYQTLGDLVENIKRNDKVILNSIKGIVVFGEERFLEVYNDSCRE